MTLTGTDGQRPYKKEAISAEAGAFTLDFFGILAE